MIICVCNNINENKLNIALDNKCKSIKDIFAFYNTQFKCSCCREYIKDEIEKYEILYADRWTNKGGK